MLLWCKIKIFWIIGMFFNIIWCTYESLLVDPDADSLLLQTEMNFNKFNTIPRHSSWILVASTDC